MKTQLSKTPIFASPMPLMLSLLLLLGLCLMPGVIHGQTDGQQATARTTALATYRVSAQQSQAIQAFEGRVEAVKQTTLSAQVAGAVTEIKVQAGDKVRAGQDLLMIDPRTANDSARASRAQAIAAEAELDVTKKELARQRQLFSKNYISQSALDQANARVKALRAKVKALNAQAKAADTQTAYYQLKAPYDGVISSVNAEQGDMAMPGKPILVIYSPQEMRVSAQVPSALLSRFNLSSLEPEQAGITLANQQRIRVAALQVLPLADISTNTQEVRARLSPDLANQYQLVPGEFAKLQLRGMAQQGAKALLVPKQAVFSRAQLRLVYVKGSQDLPLLRIVREGNEYADQVEIISGLDAGEEVYLNPHAAARVKQQEPDNDN